jgi:hypothetical protein
MVYKLAINCTPRYLPIYILYTCKTHQKNYIWIFLDNGMKPELTTYKNM